MERKSDIISVLHQGKRFANELRQLNFSNNSEGSSPHGVLLEKIMSCYDSALGLMAASVENGGGNNPDSCQNSPGSEGLLDLDSSYTKDVSKKRKTMESEQVRVCTGAALGGQLDDGHSWRKYGQKKILGTTHPRAYYRCTHRSTQGCLATKLIQRTNEDHSIFEVIYKGKHSCIPESPSQVNTHCPSTPEKKEQKNDKCPVVNHEQGLNSATAKEVPECKDQQEQEFPLVFFPSIPFECETLESLYFPETGTSLMSSSPCFDSSPTTSNYQAPYFLQSSVLDFSHEIISDTSLVTDFEFGELDFQLN